MKIWEAIQMLQQMDQTKDCTVTFGTDKQSKPLEPYPGRQWVDARGQWDVQRDTWPKNTVTCH